jgi:trehalose-6-phosphate synthase
MKIALRLTIFLLVAAVVVSAIFTFVQLRNERERCIAELNLRAAAIVENIAGPAAEAVGAGNLAWLGRIAGQSDDRTVISGIAFYDSLGRCLAMSPTLPAGFSSATEFVRESLTGRHPVAGFGSLAGNRSYLVVHPLTENLRQVGALLLCQDAAFIDVQIAGIWKLHAMHLIFQMVLIVISTVLVVRWGITGPIAHIAGWIRKFRMDKISTDIMIPPGALLGPLAVEVALLARSLEQARKSAREEARLRNASESVWTAERLKEHVRSELNGRNLFVVSNREPYMHMYNGNSIRCIIPAGGLVTALDPILRACGGIWIAHGSGSADRATVDDNNRLRVPPDEPAYSLRRVFLTQEEEDGYYYGFSNEGIWPLCHITHTRPRFALKDWLHYQEVNRKFAEAVLSEIGTEESPLILIQDYHFALLPLLIKSRRPDARVAIFWHIPWPNPEVFGICPWKEELLLGLLGADLIGFHIQFHCNNFLETVDRFLESTIRWDQFAIERRGQSTAVRPYPISVAHPYETGLTPHHPPAPTVRETIFRKIGVVAKILAVGVDRIDYTKGIVERFNAVHRFLEKYPQYIGEFTFVELGAPSRTHIQRYNDLMTELDETAERINRELQTNQWKPIVFLKAHHDHATIGEYYRASNVCMVTSLHDGMNLVAKEFIATRTDEDGVLILSQFTGASAELPDALIVNPYDIEDMADALHRALSMKEEERRRRMHDLREVVRDRNVYRWAANIISTLSHIRMSGYQATSEKP